MFERYTQRARRTIYHAKYEALSRGSSQIEPKDIVLGLTWDPHQPNCPFAMIYDNADELRKLIGSERTLYGPPTDREIPLSNDSKKALAYADRESRLDRRYSIGSDHLLRGVLRSGDETAMKIGSIGYTLSAMRQASKQAQLSNPEKVSLRKKLALHRSKLLATAAALLFAAAILYLRSQN